MYMDRISGETNHVSENSAKGYSGLELKALLGCTLFSGIDAGELTGLLGCLDARKRTFLKNEFIYHSGEPVSSMGIVLSGSVHIVKEDFWGRRHLLSEAGEGNFFAEAYASLPGTPLSVSVLAAEDSSLLFVDVSRLLDVCPSSCPFHQTLIRNVLSALAGKNLMLTKKMEQLSRRSIREKLLAYLSDVSAQAGSSSFSIPFNRQQLADYLCTDRSALSSELGRLKREGVLDFKRNVFQLNETEQKESD